MKRWRKIVIVTLILAFQLSLWASASMASHCQMSDLSTHSSHAQMDENESMHGDDHETSEDSKNQSNCECDGNINCSVSSCGAIALLNKTVIDLTYTTHSVYQRIHSLVDPADPDLLFRPPISIS